MPVAVTMRGRWCYEARKGYPFVCTTNAKIPHSGSAHWAPRYHPGIRDTFDPPAGSSAASNLLCRCQQPQCTSCGRYGRGLMDAANARNRVSDGNEGTVGNVEKSTVMRTDQVAE